MTRLIVVVALSCFALDAGTVASSGRVAAAAESAGRILFASDASGSTSLYVMNADGSAITRITRPLGNWMPQARWSPDGTRIVFSDARGLVMVHADGSGYQRLTTDSDDWEPRWSPDGKAVAFARITPNSQICDSETICYSGDVYVIDADGGAPRRVTRGGRVRSGPAWSPDGHKLVSLTDDVVV